jgi:hypothetical protein
VFLFGGGFLLLAGLAGLGATVVALVFRNSPDLIGMALSAGVAAMGAVALWHGVRALVYAGRV